MDKHNGSSQSRQLRFERAPQRVVSLVPSMTESLFDLGLGSAVVGVTDYCLHPAPALAGLPRLGGPLTPRLEEIIALRPDLVIANWEENTRADVETLEAAGIAVWVTFPKSVRETLDMLYTVASLFRSPAAQARLQTLELTLDWAAEAAAETAAGGADRPPARRYFCPLWQEVTPAGQPWWMTFNHDTYCADLLRLAGGENVFAGRERRYPLEADLGLAAAQDPAGRDTRYPRLTLEEILAAQPELVLLPDEPYAYAEAERERLQTLLADTPAGRAGRFTLVEGSLIAWHGTRLARALQILPGLFSM